MRYASLWLPLAVACSGSAPTSAEDCVDIGSAKKRDECYLAILPDVFRADPQVGITMVEAKIEDPITRDFAWYQVTKLVDPHSNKYCDRIKDEALAGRCRDIVARPHLHRDLTGGGPGGPGARPQPPPGEGPPGGPPPGGPPPGQAPPGQAPPTP